MSMSDSKGPEIKLPTRDEMLAAELPVEWHGVSMAGDRILGKVIYRFATEADRDNHLKAEAAALAMPRK
jgi:hypothetical protein